MLHSKFVANGGVKFKINGVNKQGAKLIVKKIIWWPPFFLIGLALLSFLTVFLSRELSHIFVMIIYGIYGNVFGLCFVALNYLAIILLATASDNKDIRRATIMNSLGSAFSLLLFLIVGNGVLWLFGAL